MDVRDKSIAKYERKVPYLLFAVTFQKQQIQSSNQIESQGNLKYGCPDRKVKMEKTLKEIIRVIKANCDNDLVLLKMVIELKARLEKLEEEERSQGVI